ncbi:MAG: hypothetical protein ACXWQR_16110 [Ktedonobacterales bacterium]
MAQVAKQASEQQAMQAPRGSVRTCVPYRGELARHRLITADGHDYIVTTTRIPAAKYGAQRSETYVTGAYPVLRGYLVMMRQPLYEISEANSETAREQHEQLVRVLAEAGVGVVRARRSLAARLRAEKAEAVKVDASHGVVVEIGVGARVAREERKPVVLG